MREKARKSASLWYDYINILPKHVPTFTFTDEEINELQDERMIEKFKDNKKIMLNHYDYYKQNNYFNDFFFDIKELMNAYTDIDSFIWAVSIVHSRCVYIDGKRLLVPFADMFNYDSSIRTRVGNYGDDYNNNHIIRGSNYIISFFIY